MKKSKPLGPPTQDMPTTWECIVCGVPPKRGQLFRLVSSDDSTNPTVTVQREFLADCGILGTAGPHS